MSTTKTTTMKVSVGTETLLRAAQGETTFKMPEYPEKIDMEVRFDDDGNISGLDFTWWEEEELE